MTGDAEIERRLALEALARGRGSGGDLLERALDVYGDVCIERIVRNGRFSRKKSVLIWRDETHEFRLVPYVEVGNFHLRRRAVHVRSGDSNRYMSPASAADALWSRMSKQPDRHERLLKLLQVIEDHTQRVRRRL